MLAYLIKMEAIRKPQMAKLKAKVIAAIEDDKHESRWRSLRYRAEFTELSDMATIPEDTAAKLIAILPKRAKEEPLDVDQLDAGQSSGPIGCAFLARSQPRAKGSSGPLLTHNLPGLSFFPPDIRKLGIEPPTVKEQRLWVAFVAHGLKSLPGIGLPKVGVERLYYGRKCLGDAVIDYAKVTARDMPR